MFQLARAFLCETMHRHRGLRLRIKFALADKGSSADFVFFVGKPCPDTGRTDTQPK